MITKIFLNWNWKSFFVGIFTISFALGINWELPFSQTTLLLKHGMNVFWFIGILMGIVPLSLILIYESYKENPERFTKGFRKGDKI